jgi:2-phospho-L-lactate transferase/gluconeogenesis factor (CofD/UPF0052 family)
VALADLYQDILDGMVIDVADRAAVRALEMRGLAVSVVETLMNTHARSIAVARAVLELGGSLTRALAS